MQIWLNLKFLKLNIRSIFINHLFININALIILAFYATLKLTKQLPAETINTKIIINNDYRSKIGFQKNYKYLNAMNPYKRGKSQSYIGNGNRGYQRQQQPMLLGDGNENQNYQQQRPKIKKGLGKKNIKKIKIKKILYQWH